VYNEKSDIKVEIFYVLLNGMIEVERSLKNLDLDEYA
jgi:hypothetical protein